jgi:iron complex outermembrane recepter protein
MKTFRTLTMALCILSGWFLALPAEGGTVAGKILDSRDRTPVAAATVSVPALGRSTKSSATGEFQLADLPDGKFELQVSADGFQDHQLQTASPAPQALEVLLLPLISFVDEIVVTSNRRSTPLREVSQSVGVVGEDAITTTKMVGLDEVLNSIPGVKAEAQNGTEQVRISIRGRGVRTGFGTRGIRILVDGVPESDATGETSDFSGLDLSTLRRIEVAKGPMSLQYGASPSGVVNLLTEESAATPTFEGRYLGGSFGLHKEQVKASGTAQPLNYFFNYTDTSLDGYREHSDMDDHRFYGRVGIPLGSSQNLTLTARRTQENVLLPGGLTAEELAQDRNQASFFYNLFDARQDLKRKVYSANYDVQMGADNQFSALAFHRDLKFEVPVPFIFLTGDRGSTGGNVRLSLLRQVGQTEHTLSLGGDVQQDRQDSLDFQNDNGVRGAFMFSDERDNADSSNIFVMDEVRMDRFSLRAGAAYSKLKVGIEDHLLFDGDQSGTTTFDRVSFQLGAIYQVNPKSSLYANLSTGFEPPTSSEITRGETGSGGINHKLKAQESVNYEVGGRFSLFDRVYLDFAAFHLKIDNEVLPTGTGFPQGTFNNAGRTTHDGLELSLGVDIAKNLNLKVGYTYSSFTFDKFVNASGDFTGNDIPGIPPHRLSLALVYRHPDGFGAGLDWRYVGRFFADDANAVANDSFQSTNIFLNYQHAVKGFRFLLQGGVNNVFDASYVDYVVINDPQAGYFYPSPKRNYLGSVALRWSL